jgi:hypothetical protein
MNPLLRSEMNKIRDNRITNSNILSFEFMEMEQQMEGGVMAARSGLGVLFTFSKKKNDDFNK